MGDTFFGYLEAMEINIRRPSTSEVQRIKVVGLNLVKIGEEGKARITYEVNKGIH